MSNKYKIGRYFEYKVKNALEKRGAYVIRSAGSHSIADLIVIYKNSIKLLQLKKSSKKNFRDLHSGIDIFLNYKIPLYILYKFGSRDYELYFSFFSPIRLYSGKNLEEALDALLKFKFSMIFS